MVKESNQNKGGLGGTYYRYNYKMQLQVVDMRIINQCF